MLTIKNLHVKLEDEDKQILKGVDLTVEAGKVHAIMGPNGSGKSTLSYVLSGRGGYEVTDGSAHLDEHDLLDMEPEERAAAGLFLAFQYPVEIPGVGNMTFLRTAVNAQRKARGEEELSAGDFLKVVRARAKELKIDAEMLKRPVNVGFSGGEKKRNEILQMAMLEPKMCILDETDSGLDVDAMKLVADGVNALRDAGRAFLVITHYQRLLDHIRPDVVHIMADGRIVKTGGPDLALEVERNGYADLLEGGGMMAEAKTHTTGDRLAGLTLPEGGGWLAGARKQALARLEAVGLPGRRDEYWRYTNPAPLVQAAPAPSEPAAGDDPFDGVDAYVVTIDGDALDLPDGAPEGVEITTLAQVAQADIHWAKDLYGKLEAAGSRPVSRPLAMLNTAFATGGLAIRVTGKVARPVHLRTTGGHDPILHHIVKVDAGASLTLLESGTAGARTNIVTEVDVADEGAFHHLRVQGPQAGNHENTHLFARLGQGSAFRSFTLSAQPSLTRNEAVIELTGDDASAHIAGAAFGRGGMHGDDTVFVTHDAENCESRQVFKKVLRDGATGVFQGKILVKEGAQKTDGYQISQALLLDDDSVFLAKPELEIYADDVACSHGSTTGAIDETALFYLRSRGVSKREATDLLVLSFLAEAVEEIADDGLRGHVGELLARWLARG